MRPRTALALALLVPSSAAWPCSQVLSFGASVPRDGAVDLPANAVLFVQAFGFSDTRIEVSAADPGGVSLRLAERVAPDLVRVRLGLPPGEVSELTLAARDYNVVRSMRLGVGARRDVEPPSTPDAPQVTLTPIPLDMCSGGGRMRVDAITPVAFDDTAVAAYTLEQLTEAGPEAIGYRLVDLGADDRAEVVVSGTVRETDTVCVRVVAHDLAGNISASEPSCGSLADAGVPLDAGGALDAGAARDDTGRPGQLELIEPECACHDARLSTGAPAWALGLAALLLARARRRQGARGAAGATGGCGASNERSKSGQNS